MLNAVIKGTDLSVAEVLPDLALALACNCVGDSSGLVEWYEPYVDSGQISSVIVCLNEATFTIKGKDYSELAAMPHIAVKYRGEWIGDSSVDNDHRFIYDESKAVPVLLALADDIKTSVFR